MEAITEGFALENLQKLVHFSTLLKESFFKTSINMKNKIDSFVEMLVCDWYQQPFFSSYYQERVISLLTETYFFKLIEKRNVTYRQRYDYINYSHLVQITAPLFIAHDYHGDNRFKQYLGNLSISISKYKVLNDIKDELENTLWDRCNKDKRVKEKADFIFKDDQVVANKLRESLFYTFIDDTLHLANEYFKDLNHREPFQEFTAYILAQCGIFGGLPCKCQDSSAAHQIKNEFTKKKGVNCRSIDCLDQRFQLFGMQKCLSAKLNAITCEQCKFDRFCPSFSPCPSGLIRYQKEIQRITPSKWGYPFNLTKKECEGVLSHLQWPNGIKCPKCADNKIWQLGEKNKFKKQCPECKYRYSLTSETIFSQTRTPLNKWFHSIALYNGNRNISVRELRNRVDLSNKVAKKILESIKNDLRNDDLWSYFSHLHIDIDNDNVQKISLIMPLP